MGDAGRTGVCVCEGGRCLDDWMVQDVGMAWLGWLGLLGLGSVRDVVKMRGAMLIVEECG